MTLLQSKPWEYYCPAEPTLVERILTGTRHVQLPVKGAFLNRGLGVHVACSYGDQGCPSLLTSSSMHSPDLNHGPCSMVSEPDMLPARLFFCVTMTGIKCALLLKCVYNGHFNGLALNGTELLPLRCSTMVRDSTKH